MRQASVALAVLASLSLTTAAGAAQWAPVLGARVSEPTITVLESNDTRTLIEYELAGYFVHTIDIDGQEHVVLSIPGEGLLMENGMPDLPTIRKSIILPDDGLMGARIVEAEYEVRSTLPVAPSKGHFTRDVDPATVPFTFAALYGADTWYPAQTALLHEPYILRDFRGAVAQVNPIQYNPAQGALRIAKRIVVEIAREAPGGANTLDRTGRPDVVASDFDAIYRGHFINYGMDRYTPIAEPGNLMVITYDAFRPYVDPLVDWKLEKGIPAKVRNLSTIGSTSAQVKAFIDSLYSSPEGITYVILVGDKAQMPTMQGTIEGADSDPCYAKCAGGDHYPDLFISRLSAQTAAEVEIQVLKCINYEKYPHTGAAAEWYHKGTGIASSQGSPPDYTRCEWLRDMLLAYTYTHVDQIYDPGATASQVTTALNDGRSIVNYLGHGSGTSWSTTGFSNGNVHALMNVDMLPWIIDVACLNGDFGGHSECFAEAWLRAGSPSAPTGAIGMYSASTSASWVPPCDMQYHAVELFTTEQTNTLGGMLFGGVMHAMDLWPGSEGVKLMEQYHIFGDCSLMVRSDVPAPLDMAHLGVLLIGLTTYDVTVTDASGPVDGALVCAQSGAPDDLFAYGYTNASGQVTLDLGAGATTVGTLDLTATAYNCVPDFDSAAIIPPEGAYCVHDSHVIDDDNYGTSSGNGDGLADAGEQIELIVTLKNVGNDIAYGVTATLTESSPYATLADDYEEFGDVPAGGTAQSLDDFDVVIAGDCPDGHMIPCTLEATDGTDTWMSIFSVPVCSADLSILDVVVDDAPGGGNGNGCPEAGETVSLSVSIENTGSKAASNVTAILSSTDPYVVIGQDQAAAAAVAGSGGTATLTPDFTVALRPDVPDFHQLVLHLDFSADGGFSGDDEFEITVGASSLSDDFESGEGPWTHSTVTAGYGDQWHMETYRYHSSNHTWKFGGAGSSSYADLSDGVLVSPPVCLGADGQMTFWDWLDAEEESPTWAWDCALVEVSTDGGATWVNLPPVGGYSHLKNYNPVNPLPEGTPCWSGYHTWREESFDLTAYEGTMALFRFRFASDGYVTEEGWYVDDVMITSTTTGVEGEQLSLLPARFALDQNVPNPFNPVTTIHYALPENARVTIRVYNVAGKAVKTLKDAEETAGYKSVAWDGTDEAGRSVASGIYFYGMTAGGFSDKRSMVLLK